MATKQEIMSKIINIKGQNDQYTGRCPAHDDKKNSLSIGFDSEKCKLYCHAGCETEAICSAMSLEIKDLFFEERKPENSWETVYDYRDSDGELVYQVIRKPGKQFLQRRPSNGGWIYSIKDIEPIPYRLNELVRLPTDRFVFICEGEKDADNLNNVGLFATTKSGGASNWPKKLNKYFEGRRVIILPDNDNPGLKQARRISNELINVSEMVRILELPGIPLKGDVSDWLEGGGTARQLLELVKQSEPEEDESGPYKTFCLDGDPPDPTRWIINRLLPNGVCMQINAEQKAGKTWLVCDMALALATNTACLDFDVEEPGKTLIYTPEGSGNSLKRRMWGLCYGKGLDPNKVLAGTINVIGDRINLANPKSLNRTALTIRKIKPKLLIFDPLISCYAGVDENNNNEMQSMLNGIRDILLPELCDNGSIVITHHMKKGYKDESGWHGGRGASALPAWSDGLISMKYYSKDRDDLRIDIEHRDDPSYPRFKFIKDIKTRDDGLIDVALLRESIIEAEKTKKPGQHDELKKYTTGLPF